MSIPITVNAIKYPSYIAYYRTIEDQGDHTCHAFYMYIKLNHDPEFRERQKQQAMKSTFLRYHTDPDFKVKVNKTRYKLYRKKRVAKMFLLLLQFNFFYYN